MDNSGIIGIISDRKIRMGIPKLGNQKREYWSSREAVSERGEIDH
jgi:hypothetical protein